MDRSKLFRASTLAAMLGATLLAHADNLVVDGDFESAAPGSTGTPYFAANQTFDGYWTVGGTGVGIDIDDGFNLDGDKSVFLDYDDIFDLPTDGPGLITQTLATTLGQSYLVSFEVNTDDVSAFTATFGGTTLLDAVQVPISSFNNPTPTQYSFTVVATSTATALSFAGFSSASATVELDDVSVVAQPTPEPTTTAALGLGALALLRRRRTASRDTALQIP